MNVAAHRAPRLRDEKIAIAEKPASEVNNARNPLILFIPSDAILNVTESACSRAIRMLLIKELRSAPVRKGWTNLSRNLFQILQKECLG